MLPKRSSLRTGVHDPMRNLSTKFSSLSVSEMHKYRKPNHAPSLLIQTPSASLSTLGALQDNEEARRVMPQEVIELIMDMIDEDMDGITPALKRRRTLCNCALTCTAWLPRSRYLLYRRIYLNDRIGLELLADLSRQCGKAWLFSHMQELEIDESWQRIQDPFAHLAPLLLGPIVSTLTSLRLGAVYWDRSANHPAYLAHSRLYSSAAPQ